MDGDVELLQVNGSVIDESTIEVGGNATRIDIRRDLTDESEVDVGGDLETLTIGGSVIYDSYIDLHGNVGEMTIGGSFADSDIDVTGGLGTLLVRGSVADGSYFSLADTGEITIRGDLTGDSDLNIDGDLGTLVIGGALSTESDVYVEGNAARIVIQEWLEADGVSVDGNLEFLQVRSAVDGDSEDLYVGGDLGTALFASIVELNIDVDGSADEITVRGGTADFQVDVDGDLGLLSIGRGATNDSETIDIGGNATSIQVTGGANNFDVDIDGTLQEFLVKGTLVGSEISVAGGITTFTVTEVVTGCDIETQDWDGGGNPIGAGIGTFQVGELRDAYVGTHGDIGEFIVDGAVTDSVIETTAYDSYGEGDLVGGGGINSFQALGLYDGLVETYGSITEMLIGRGGIDTDSDVALLGGAGFGGGNLVKLQTPGFIFGDIYVTGDVVDILTGGADALPGSAPVDFFFVDNHSFPTGGELEVEGAILGTIS